MSRSVVVIPTMILATVVFAIGAAVIRGRLAERRRLRRVRLRYAVLGAYMTGNKIATVIASALELHETDVYAALAELESRGWLTTKLDLPSPRDNQSPPVTATKGWLMERPGIRVPPTSDPGEEFETERDARMIREGDDDA